jgi:hypothetical protein
MSVNKFLPHVHILPEDDANRQIANGFFLNLPSSRQRQFDVLEVAGGWNEVIERFCSVHAVKMEAVPTRFMVLVIDFDNQADRLAVVSPRIPLHLKDRVFILGTLSEPEKLKSELGSYEAIGRAMAQDCRDGTDLLWAHRLLRHNASEILRLRTLVQPFLFASE